VYVADEETKLLLLEHEAGAVFTTPHFDGYAIVLVALAEADEQLTEALVEDAWRARAPKRLVVQIDS
jgi:hypothetical protein